YRLKYHSSTDFQEFRSRKEQTDAIALTPEEIELLWAYRPRYKMYREARDLFLIGYYTGARFSDYSRLGKGNIHDGVIEFVQQKTDDKVFVPVSPRLLEIMERNGGKAPVMNHVVFNRYIKKVAKDAGIDGVVQLPKSKRKEDGQETHRWEMVSSHTARRSLLTNLYQSGVSARDCMAISGHKSISSFERYLKISHEQSVEKLKGNSIFQ
ncbi:MAG: integrase catalytic domain-containing protein, partial [Oscillospiraceae bacterium]|nr:integrase catalytic domain-containing protein [Oscillospiraceae bacterium]